MSTLLRYTVGPLLAVVLAACGGPTLKEEPAGEFAEQGLHPVSRSGFEQAWARPGANLPAYRVLDLVDLHASDAQFSRTAPSGTVRAQWQMNPQLEQDLQQRWREASGRAFADYDLAGEGDEVLRITTAITRVAAWRSASSVNTAPGQSGATTMESVRVYAEFRLLDGASGDLLAVIRDQRTIPLPQWTRGGAQGLTSTFNSWAGLLHTRVSGR